MSLLRSCPCGIPEGTDLPHLRTDCPHYGELVTFPTALGHGGYLAGGKRPDRIVVDDPHCMDDPDAKAKAAELFRQSLPDCLRESDDARKVEPRPRRPILKLRMGGK